MKKILKSALCLTLIVITLFSLSSEAFALDQSLFRTQYQADISAHPEEHTGQGAAEMVRAALSMVGKTGNDVACKGQWCASFVSCCAVVTGQKKAIPYNTGVKSIINGIKKAKGTVVCSNNKSKAKIESARPGDIVAYNNWGHVEIIVAKPSGGYVQSVGGNWGAKYANGKHDPYNSKVVKHKFKYSKVTYIVRPNYVNTTPVSSYQIRYAVNAPSGCSYSGSMANTTVIVGKSAVLAKNTYSVPGYTFNGWNTMANGSGASYADGATVSNLSTTNGVTVTLYAQWKKAQTAAEYLASCNTIETYLILTASNSKDYIKTLPCSKGTCSASENVRRITEGENFTATAIYWNSAGNYWYKVTASDGKSGFIYGGCAYVSSVPSDALTGGAKLATTTPKVGKAVNITGTLTSKTLVIKSVKGILSGNGSTQQQVVNVNGRSLNIKSSAINKNLKFGKLKAGAGTLQLTVVLEGYSTNGSSLFTRTITWTQAPVKFTVKK